MSKTIKVRIALEINSDGEWFAYGFTRCKSWKEAMECFDTLDGETKRHWITAEVPLPDAEPEAVVGRSETA